MTQYLTEAIVLGTKNFGTADKIVHLFTSEKGYVEAIAFGARRPKNSLAGLLELFNRLDLSLTLGERLDTIKTCILKESFTQLAEDINKMPYAAFFSEIVSGLSPVHQTAKEVYDFLLEVFPLFNKHNPRLVAVIASFQLLDLLGIGLAYEKCINCGKILTGDDNLFAPLQGGAFCKNCEAEKASPYTEEKRNMLNFFLHFDFKNPQKFTLKGAHLRWAEENLILYVEENLGRKLRSLEFLRQLR